MSHFIDCLGSVENENKTVLNFIKKEYGKWDFSVQDDCDRERDMDLYKSVNLFNNDYHKTLAVRLHLNELFCYCRKYFQFLSKSARNAVIPINMASTEYQDFGHLRRSIMDFFVFIRDSLQDVKNLIQKGDLDKAKILLADIKQHAFSFRLMLKSVDNLPDYIIRNSTSEVGNQCLLASFHLFHAHLELHWLHLTIMFQVYALEKIFEQETMLESEEANILSDYHSEKVLTNDYSEGIEMELEWMLYNLVLLANKCFEKIGIKEIFSCSCIKQIWLLTQLLIENLNNQNKCADFWHYYNKVIKKFVLHSDADTETTQRKECNVLFNMSKIVCVNVWEFNILLLLNVVQLQGYSSEGNFDGITSHRIKPNYSLLEDILKQFLNNESNITESILREQMRHIVKLLTIWWESKNDVISLLWEYFHKRLNSAFSIAGKEDSSLSFVGLSAPNIINDLKSRFSLDCSAACDDKLENSFSLFITLLGAHLKKSVDTNQHSNCQRIKGRILPKFTQSKILALNELGLEHFAVIFFMMGISTDFSDMCSKLQNLISQIPFDTLPWSKKQVVIKIYICILYLHIDNGSSIEVVSKPLLSIANKYCSVRDSESMALTKSIVIGVQDILDTNQNFECSEYVLIDTWLPKYLLICTLSDLTTTLESMSSVITKLNIIGSYNGFSSEDSSAMVDKLFQHILPCIKTLFSNGTVSLQIADTAYVFTKFTFDNVDVVKKHVKYEDVIKYFLLCDTGNEKVIRHYLTQILQDERLCESLASTFKTCASFIIHSWIRCSLLSIEHSDDDTHLMLLLCQLPQFSSLNVTPSCNSGDQRNLCNFFRAIGMKWNQSQNFQERCQLRESINEYLQSMDKYVVSAIKTPPSQEYVMQIFLVLGTLFINCSPIIYSRAKPSCLLHSIVGNILLPPQLFMEKKLHPYIVNSICKSWYMFMRGLYVLDYKNDAYIEKAMRDMIVQYLPYFVAKTIITKNNTFDVSFRLIPNDTTSDLILEKYILEKISSTFVTCRRKQSHVNAPKALAVIYNMMLSTTSITLINVILTCTLVSICEQFMFSETGSTNKKISGQILEFVFKNQYFNSDTDGYLRDTVRVMLESTCKKHLAFNSSSYFKLILSHLHGLVPIIDSILNNLDGEISKVERMRGVGFDHGLRNGLKEIVTAYSKVKGS